MSFMMHQQMITGGETRWERTSPEVKKDFLQEQTQSMGNNGDEGEEIMKMWEENGIAGNENMKVVRRGKRNQINGKKRKTG